MSLNLELTKAFNESICCYTQEDIDDIKNGDTLCNECDHPLKARYVGYIIMMASYYYQITCQCDESLYYAVLDTLEEEG